MPVEDRLDKEGVTLPGGATIRYFVGGDSDSAPVVLLHGGGTDHAMLSWRDTIPALLDAGYRVYAANQPGYGDSPADTKPSTMETLIGYLAALMDHWQIEKAALVGVSMGGGMAIGYTLAHPGRVERLVLVGSYGIQDRAPFHLLSYYMIKMQWLTDLLWSMARGSRWAARYSLRSIIRNPESLTESLVDEVFEAMQDPTSQRTFAQWQQDEMRRDGAKTNYVNRLSEIDVPVLMVHGSGDILVPLKYAQQAVGHFKNARLEVIENAGHWTQRDTPARFNQLLLGFLSRPGSA